MPILQTDGSGNYTSKINTAKDKRSRRPASTMKTIGLAQTHALLLSSQDLNTMNNRGPTTPRGFMFGENEDDDLSQS